MEMCKVRVGDLTSDPCENLLVKGWDWMENVFMSVMNFNFIWFVFVEI